MKSIILVRHAQYNRPLWEPRPERYSLDDLLANTNGDLSSNGIKQAAITAERLNNLEINEVVSSPLKRALSTATIISELKGIHDIRISNIFSECLPTVPDGASEEVLGVKNSDILKSRSIADRAYNEIVENLPPEGMVNVVVSHGNLIRYFLVKFLNLPPEDWNKFDVMNCGITSFEWEQNEMRLTSFNDVGHINAKLRSYG